MFFYLKRKKILYHDQLVRNQLAKNKKIYESG